MASSYLPSRRIRSLSSSPTNLDRLVSCRAASIRAHLAVSSSSVIVTFLTKSV